MPRVEDLLATLYGDDPAYGVHTADHYPESVRAIWRAFGALEELALDAEDPPTLHVVFSPFGKPRSLRLDSSEHIIYDVRLRRTFIQLDQLARSDFDFPHFWVIIDQLYADRCLISGRSVECAAFIIMLQLIADRVQELRPSESREAMNRLSTSLVIKEYFAIAHELAHTVVRLRPLETARAMKTYKERLALVEEQMARHNPETVAEMRHRYVDQKIMTVRRIPERFENDVEEYVESARKAATEWVESGAFDEGPRQWALAKTLNDENLLEEVYCDRLATIAVIHSFRHLRSAEVLADVAAAIHHLRLVELLDSYAAGPGKASQSVKDATVREWMFDNWVIMAFQQEETEQVRADIQKVFRTCVQRLTDPILTGFSPSNVVQTVSQEVPALLTALSGERIEMWRCLGYLPPSGYSHSVLPAAMRYHVIGKSAFSKLRPAVPGATHRNGAPLEMSVDREGGSGQPAPPDRTST